MRLKDDDPKLAAVSDGKPLLEPAHRVLRDPYSGSFANEAAKRAEPPEEAGASSFQPILVAPIVSRPIHSRTGHGVGTTGMILEVRDRSIVVKDMIPYSPAHLSQAVKRGDLLRLVDGEKVNSVAEALQLLQGDSGTSVLLVLQREGTAGHPQFLEVELRRSNMFDGREIFA